MYHVIQDSTGAGMTPYGMELDTVTSEIKHFDLRVKHRQQTIIIQSLSSKYQTNLASSIRTNGIVSSEPGFWCFSNLSTRSLTCAGSSTVEARNWGRF
jgi:hypothetical protein